VQALTATTEAVLLSTYGGLADLERRINNALAPVLAAQRVMLFAFQEAQDMLRCADGTKRSLQACPHAHGLCTGCQMHRFPGCTSAMSAAMFIERIIIEEWTAPRAWDNEQPRHTGAQSKHVANGCVLI
jgi:hypothetical protein